MLKNILENGLSSKQMSNNGLFLGTNMCYLESCKEIKMLSSSAENC